MIVPSMNFSFSGHESFPFRFPWMKKGFDAVLEDSTIFQQEDATSKLGVGKNMVRSIRHWCLTAGVLEEKEDSAGRAAGLLQPTEFGRLIFADDGFDPYLEDNATLWLLHWMIVTCQNRASTWFWCFNHFHEPIFTRDEVANSLLRWTQILPGKKIAESSVKRDVEVFFRTYLPTRIRLNNTEDTIDCPLIELDLIENIFETNTYRFSQGVQESLPDGVLLYSVLSFWEKNHPKLESLSLGDLAKNPGGPGLVFKIPEAALVVRLEEIEKWTRGAISYRESAGIRQLFRKKHLDPLAALEMAYGATKVQTRDGW